MACSKVNFSVESERKSETNSVRKNHALRWRAGKMRMESPE